ncbi:MAG: hypothetical protein ACFFED_07625 [Candidatus Thorarchaeota archaeon]
MRTPRTIQEILEAFEEHAALFLEAGIEKGEVLPGELIEYFAGDTPTGDVTTLDDVIANRWLLLHEVTELKHLKLKGIEITREVVWERFVDVLEAHFAATAVELKMALKYNDKAWIKKRLSMMPLWLEDSNIPDRLRIACRSLIEHYSI